CMTDPNVSRNSLERARTFPSTLISCNCVRRKYWNECSSTRAISHAVAGTPAIAMIEWRSISKPLSARSYTTVLPAVARRSPATSTPPENLKARIVVASVGCQEVSRGVATWGVELTTAAGARKPLCRSSAGKSPIAPEKFWSSATGNLSITDPCAGDSAWIGWGRPCAFFLRDPSCPGARRPVNAGRRHRLAWDPTELVQPAFGYARASKKLRTNVGKASCASVAASLLARQSC